jgi:hypothetical protein
MPIVLAGAIVLHLVYGAIMGSLTALFLEKQWHKKQDKVADSKSSASIAG